MCDVLSDNFLNCNHTTRYKYTTSAYSFGLYCDSLSMDSLDDYPSLFSLPVVPIQTGTGHICIFMSSDGVIQSYQNFTTTSLYFELEGRSILSLVSSSNLEPLKRILAESSSEPIAFQHSLLLNNAMKIVNSVFLHDTDHDCITMVTKLAYGQWDDNSSLADSLVTFTEISSPIAEPALLLPKQNVMPLEILETKNRLSSQTDHEKESMPSLYPYVEDAPTLSTPSSLVNNHSKRKRASDVDTTSSLNGSQTDEDVSLSRPDHFSLSDSILTMPTDSDSDSGCSNANSASGRRLRSPLVKRRRRIRPPPFGEKCGECGKRSSSEWRKGPIEGHLLCNACGLRFLRRSRKAQ